VSDVTLRDEVERLRADNEALQRKANLRRTVRRASVVGLLIGGCGLALLSVVAIWLRVTLLNTDHYVKTVAPIAAQPAVQKAVANQLGTAINSKIDFNQLARDVLPDRADVLAPAIASGVQAQIRSRLNEFTASPRFQQLWTDANRRAHTRLVELLTVGRSKRLELQGDTVYLDLSPAVQRVKDALNERGLTRISAAIPPTVDGKIKLVQSSAITDAQSGIKLLKGAAIVLPFLALIFLGASAALTKPWRRGVMHAAIGVVISMLILIALVAFGRSAYLDALANGALPRDAAGDIFDQVAAFLRHGVRIVAVAAVAVAVVAFIFGLPLRRYAETGWRRFATDTRTTWIAAHERNLMIGVGVAVGLVLLVWSPLTGGTVVILVIVAGALLGAIAAISAPHRRNRQSTIRTSSSSSPSD